MIHRDKKAVALAVSAVISSASILFASPAPGAEVPLQAASTVPVINGNGIGQQDLYQLNMDEFNLNEWPDNDVLFSEYANRLFGIEPHTIRASKNLAGSSLSGSARKIYDYLKQEIAKVASGERTSAVFLVPVTQFLERFEFPKAELDLSSGDVSAQILHISDDDINNIYYALLYDCPYELYWHNKSIQIQRPNLMDHGTTVSIAEDDAIVFYFSVDAGYAEEGGASYQTSPNKITAAKTAVATADEIIRQAASLSDYDKLAFYRRRICELTEYNYNVIAEGNTNARDPWQLIYVFDNDLSTNVVCEGYAKAFQYLCDQTNFQDNDLYSFLVSGKTSDGVTIGPHMWNVVHMGTDGNYIVDVTNCDTGTIGEGEGLFLVGYTSGSVQGGYRVRVPSGQTITYHYAQEMFGIYSTGDLSLQQGRCHHWEVIASTDASCTEPGQVVYRCKDCGRTKTEQTAASGHAYEAAFTWSENMESCIVTLTCKNDSTHQKSAEATVTSEITKPATCVSKGTAIYTASAAIDGQTYQEQKTAENIEVNPENHVGGTEIRNEKKATSKASGYTGDIYCQSCHAKIAEGKGITTDGNFLEKMELAEIPAIVTIESDPAGNVLHAQADISQSEIRNQAALSGNVLSKITEAAGTENITVTMAVKSTDGSEKYQVTAEAKDLSVGNKLKIYQIDSKTNDYVMVNAKTYTVNPSGSVSVAIAQNGVFQLLNTTQSAKVDRAILKTAKAKKISASIQTGKSTRMKLSNKLNMKNIRKITYTSSKKDVATVSSNGKVTTKKPGTATIKAKVIFKNRISKTVSMKLKVK